ncbi:MAG: hypothetical protein KKG59_03440 [Nanoarchaeota archaeon]|nr:hypothetical protein [Nanoarchaeota archaeon]
MQKLKILNSKEAKKIYSQLDDQFGFSKKLDCTFLVNTKRKVYMVSKDIGNIDMDNLRIDSIGLYFGTIYDDGFRVTIEGSQIIGPDSTKNILKLEEENLSNYIKGMDLDIEDGEYGAPGYYLISNGKDFFGCAKVTTNKIMNFVSKARRLRVVNE